MILKRINQLLDYGLTHQLFFEDDFDYVLQRIGSLLEIKDFVKKHYEEESIDSILNDLAENNHELKSLLLDCLLPRPSDLNKTYRAYYKKSPQQATTFFYQFSLDSHNVYPNWKDNVQIDEVEQNGYSFKQLTRKPIQPNILLKYHQRTMSISFNNEKKAWLLKYHYQPWLEEQGMVYRKKALDIKNSQERYNEMLNFLNKYPHYFIVPKVQENRYDSSVYEVGKDVWPIENAEIKQYFKSKRIKIQILNWPISVVRLIGNNENRLLDEMFQLERACQSFFLEKHVKPYPMMKLDGSQFHVYVFFIKEDNLKTLEGLKLLGYQYVDEVKNKDDYLNELTDLNGFKNQEDDFISFIQKAI
jgi:UDPglucose--hexose-1-phosphate uridylyltransferase